MLNIFNNKLSSAGINLAHGTSSTASSFSQLDKLPAAGQDYVRHHAKNAIIVAFYGITAFMWLGVVAMAFLGNVDIKKDAKATDTLAEWRDGRCQSCEGSIYYKLVSIEETARC